MSSRRNCLRGRLFPSSFLFQKLNGTSMAKTYLRDQQVVYNVFPWPSFQSSSPKSSVLPDKTPGKSSWVLEQVVPWKQINFREVSFGRACLPGSLSTEQIVGSYANLTRVYDLAKKNTFCSEVKVVTIIDPARVLSSQFKNNWLK